MLEVALKGLADWQRDRDRDFNLKMDDVIINSRNPVVGVCVCVCVFLCSFVFLQKDILEITKSRSSQDSCYGKNLEKSSHYFIESLIRC